MIKTVNENMIKTVTKIIKTTYDANNYVASY